jgi:hypothetical protein
MKQKDARPQIIAAWDEWVAGRGLDPGKASGRDALQFYFDLQDMKSPLLRFSSRARDKWEVIYDWLQAERRVGL